MSSTNRNRVPPVGIAIAAALLLPAAVGLVRAVHAGSEEESEICRGLWAFQNLGWMPNGDVRCRYSVQANNSSSGTDDRFVGRVECDLDGDGVPMVYTCTELSKARPDTDHGIY